MRRILFCTTAALCLAAPLRAQGFGEFWTRLVNPEVEVELRHPPSLGLKLTRVGFMPGINASSNDLIAACSMDLTARGELDLVDRANLDRVVKEQQLGETGYMDPETVTKMGKLLGAQAIVTVNVSQDKVTTSQLYKDNSYTDKNGKYHSNKSYISRTKIAYMASVQVTDLVTGRVFQTKRIAADPALDAESDRGYPDYPSELQVRELAIAQARTEVHRMLLPWTERKRLVFFDDKDYGMKEAYQALKERDSNRAIAKSRDAIDKVKDDPKAKPKYKARVNYNMGMCLFIEGMHDEALPYLQAACDMDSSNGVFKQSLGECKVALDLRAEGQKVDERTAEQRKRETEAEWARQQPAPEKAAPEASAKPKGEAAKGTPEERLKKLNQMRKQGLIDDQEYKAKKAEILKEM